MGTFTALTGSGAGSAFVAGDKWGYQNVEKVRQDLNALSSARYTQVLATDRNVAVMAAAITDHPAYSDVLIDWDDIGGMTVRARVEVRTENAATTVTPVIWNQTAGSAAITGSASSTTSWAEQLLTIPSATGVVRYRLRLTPSDAVYAVRGVGIVEIYV